MATIYYTATTLDGFLATTDNSLSWLFEVPGAEDAESSIPDFMAGVGPMAMGSTTYEWVVQHETLLETPEKWTEWYGDKPTWVFTHRDLPVVEGANITFTQAPVAEVHAEMVEAAGDNDIWLMGGGDLVGQFADAGLLDDLILAVGSVFLGGGAPLLPRRITPPRLRLVSATPDGEDFVTLRYELQGTP